jgi:hypothetical protein
MKKLDLKKGDKIKVINNSIFKTMGFIQVTGVIFMIFSDQQSLALKCDQTGMMEKLYFNDGLISKEE